MMFCERDILQMLRKMCNFAFLKVGIYGTIRNETTEHTMTILDYIQRHATTAPQRNAIILCASDGSRQTISYASLLNSMKCCEPLPIPLLGSRWDGDFTLYTTGSTGRPKGVVISQRAVICNSENLIEGHGYTHDTRFVIAGPMDHLGCWSKLFPTLMMGGMLYIMSDGMKDINAILDTIEDEGSGGFALFMVPSAIRIMLTQAADRLSKLSNRIDFIEAGGAPLPRPDMLRLCDLMPHTRLYNTYASTETGVVCTYNYNDGRCLSGCLGRPLKHSRVFITSEGTIACQGETLMSRYEGEPELTAAVMREGTFYTADGGWIDDEGMLHITGRTDDIINVGGFKLAPQEVEEAALSHPSVRDCICVSHEHAVLGEAPELLLVLDDGQEFDKRGLARHIAAQVERYKVPLYYTVTDEIRKTPNGKLDRKAYRRN